MKFLYTTCCTQFQVSDKDEIFLAGFTWKLTPSGHIQGSGGKYKYQMLHRVIAKRMNLDLTNDIDHKDTNSLNNQRENLRAATRSQNSMNRKPNNPSGFKGVSWNKRDKVYEVKIHVNGKSKHLGSFSDPKEASKIHDEASLKYHGEFARF